MSGTLVIQALPGIGDMLWHLPFIRSLALHNQEPVHLMTRERTAAKTWLYNEPSIKYISYLEKKDVIKTGWGLRSAGYTSAWLLHGGTPFAFVPLLAGIPFRAGPGFGKQKYFLTTPPLSFEVACLSHIDQIRALFKQMNLELRAEDQRITLDPKALDFIRKTYAHIDGPWITFGAGASESFKRWPADFFVRLGILMSGHQSPAFFVCGSPDESTTIRYIADELAGAGVRAIPVDNLDLPKTFALLSRANLFIGNDSGLLNASACTGVPSVGLFGSTKALNYSPFMHAIIPPDGTQPGECGMRAISPEQVMAAIQNLNLYKDWKS